MKYEMKPIVIVPSIANEDGSVSFLHRQNKYDIDPSNRELLWNILKYCNGYYTITDISDELHLDKNTVRTVIDQLEGIGVICDSSKQYLHFNALSSYPDCFHRILSRKEIEKHVSSPKKEFMTGDVLQYEHMESLLANIITSRRSCRSFSSKKVSKNIIGNLCRCGYSINSHAVPSGGALYPLKIFIIVLENQDDLLEGYYEYDYDKDTLIRFNDRVDKFRLKHCFNSESIAFNSPIQIVIAGDIDRQPYKYGNRGYRFTLMEVGHVAQNINLFCAENGLATCELGGILDCPTRDELSLVEGIVPLVGIAIGYPDLNGDTNYDKERILVENLLRKMQIKEEDVNITTFEDNSTFFGAALRCDENNVAGATGASYHYAVLKTLVEACERRISGKMRIDFQGEAMELIKQGNMFINPDDIVPLLSYQKEKMRFDVFTMEKKINWTKAFSYKLNCNIFVPSDIVYYGNNLNGVIYSSNSSGVAAHFDKEIARDKALAELLERDAIMRCWYSKKTPEKIKTELLPWHVRKRKEYWMNQGKDLIVLSLESKYAFVTLTLIVSDDYPCFVCGAAATYNYSKNSFEDTIEKSVEEAEYAYYSAVKTADKSDVVVDRILTPYDHGKYYYKYENMVTLKWLWTNATECGYPEIHNYDFHTAAKELNLMEIELSDSNDPVFVIRLLSTELVPISFGTYMGHWSHKCLKENIDKEMIYCPHFFA